MMVATSELKFSSLLPKCSLSMWMHTNKFSWKYQLKNAAKINKVIIQILKLKKIVRIIHIKSEINCALVD